MIIRKILHIAPALPPAINGLGDFCQIVADNLDDAAFRTHAFLVRRGADVDDHVKAFGPDTFLTRLRSENPDVLLLHYVGYAYDKHGLPFYMVRAMRQYKRETRCRIFIFFHEIFATGTSPFQLHAWTGRLQKMIARQLCLLADCCFTSCRHYADLLRKVTGNPLLRVVCSGIFSNIPDRLYCPTTRKEEASIVVFGSSARRKNVYENPRFRLVLQRLRINRIYDIGPGDCRFVFSGAPVNVMGILTAEEIAGVLNKSKYGALVYKPHLLGKSGIFSAYTAFGVIPVNLVSSGQPLGDGLVEGVSYFSWDGSQGVEMFTGDRARNALVDWYGEHSEDVVCRMIEAEITGSYRLGQTLSTGVAARLTVENISESAGV